MTAMVIDTNSGSKSPWPEAKKNFIKPWSRLVLFCSKIKAEGKREERN
jgi:hypothetical protein